MLPSICEFDITEGLFLSCMVAAGYPSLRTSMSRDKGPSPRYRRQVWWVYGEPRDACYEWSETVR